MAEELKPAAVRQELVRSLRLDLIGPEPGSPYERETLPQAPSRWYLTGFLVPYEAPAEQREDEQGQEQLDLSDPRSGTDDDTTPQPASARRAFFPSSIGPRGLKLFAPPITGGTTTGCSGSRWLCRSRRS